MFAGTGSTMSAATVPSFASKSDAISSRSLKGAIRVSRAAPAVTPGVLGMPKRREPAAGAAREQRVGVTVVAALELDRGCRLPVAPRASRIADIAASVPEDTSRTCSIEGTIATIRSASCTSASVGTPNEVPREAASVGGLDDLLPRVPEERCAPRLAEVDVPCAVGVLEVGALAPDREARRAAHRPERPDRRVHAAGDRSLRSLEEVVGSAHRPVSLWASRAVVGCGP